MYHLTAKITNHLCHHGSVPRFRGLVVGRVVVSCAFSAQSFTTPAGIRPALRKQATSILPGGRIIAPLGEQFTTGAGPFGLMIGPSARLVVTSNAGPGPNSLTILNRERNGHFSAQTIAARLYDSDEIFGQD